MFEAKSTRFARTINWVETIVKGILTFLVQETCKYILARLRSRKEKIGLLLRKWGLSGLGSVFIGWAVLSFFGWIAFSVNAAVHEGVASAPHNYSSNYCSRPLGRSARDRLEPCYCET